MYGYGNEDLFSPLRTEASFNDSPYSSQRDSGGIPDFLQGTNSQMEKNMSDFMNPKRNNTLENVNTRREENKLIGAVQNDFIPTMNFEDMFGNPFDKDFGIDSSMLENKLTYPNKRGRASSLSGKEYSDMNYNLKNVNSLSKSKQVKQRYNESMPCYPTSKSDVRRGREQTADKPVTNDNNQFPSNNLLKCSEQREVEVIDLESIDMCDSNPEENKTVPVSTSNDSQGRLQEPDLECVQEIVRTPKRNFQDCYPEDINMCTPSIQGYPNQQQIQATIIEKLIRETVSVEFEAIRQLLYLQQMFLFRHLHLHKNMEIFESRSPSSSEFMLRVIEELLHENRQLKKAVIAQQRRT